MNGGMAISTHSMWFIWKAISRAGTAHDQTKQKKKKPNTQQLAIKCDLAKDNSFIKSLCRAVATEFYRT